MILFVLEFIILIALLLYGMIIGAYLILCLSAGLIRFERWEMKINHHRINVKYYKIITWFLITGVLTYEFLSKFNFT